MFNAMDSNSQPQETFYDGYVVNAIMDACYRSAASKQWEPVQLIEWRGQGVEAIRGGHGEYEGHTIIKQEKMPDGRLKLILKNKESGEFMDRIVAG